MGLSFLNRDKRLMCACLFLILISMKLIFGNGARCLAWLCAEVGLSKKQLSFKHERASWRPR